MPLSVCPQDPFSDPSQASLTCLATRPVTIKDEKEVVGSEGREIFSERKGLNLFQNKARRRQAPCCCQPHTSPPLHRLPRQRPGAHVGPAFLLLEPND